MALVRLYESDSGRGGSNLICAHCSLSAFVTGCQECQSPLRLDVHGGRGERPTLPPRMLTKPFNTPFQFIF
jgi:hypothetical protein